MEHRARDRRISFSRWSKVDGEDLAASLRRIGRFSEDKAIDIARQLCAGLAAAHERGVLHRDLKPPNIMIDGDGHVRLMDFGLAALGEVSDIRAGTPAYMAPEQLEGREVSVRSDIYALGLVLYELFTGRRAFEAKTIAELVEQHHSGTLTAPTTLVKTLDPAIERAILRCLDPDPARRPSSALAVSAALPGGDPLAAALAAGETPSPEMVAAAGGADAALSKHAGLAWLAAAAVLLVAAMFFLARTSIFERTPFSKPAAVLVDRAEEIRQTFGYSERVADQASGFASNASYLRWAQQHGAGDRHWPDLASGSPAVLEFWYRTSPRPLVPTNPLAAPGPADPPMLVTGMTLVRVDAQGRLLFFAAMPPQAETSANASAPVDWNKVFAAAGLDRALFVDAAPERTPASYADERRAWTGVLPGSENAVRIEVAGYRGRPVFFQVVGPWTYPTRDPGFSENDANTTFSVVLVLAFLIISAILARRNLQSGRADRRGAFRLAVFMSLLLSAGWVFAPHFRQISTERDRLFSAIAISMFVAGALYLVYLALEPFVRKSWPTMLIGWSRLIGGSFRDPVVGRDVLIGIAAGAALTVLDSAHAWAPAALGWIEPVPQVPTGTLDALFSLRALVATMLNAVNAGLQNGLFTVLQFSIGREAIRLILARLKIQRISADRALAVVAVILVTMSSLIDSSTSAKQAWLPMVYQALSLFVSLFVMMRVGLLAGTVAFIVNSLTERVPVTFDASKFYAGQGWLVFAAVFACAVGAMWMARGRQLSRAAG